MTESASTTPVIISRRYPAAPMVGVGVAVFDRAGRLLLVQRGRPPGLGTWGLPGGLIDLGEKVVAAVVREVMEEVGITVEVGDLVTTFEPIYRDAQGVVEYHYVVLEYWAHYIGGEPMAQDDAAAVAWAEMTNLDAYVLTPQQLEVIHKAHAAWRAASSPHAQTANHTP
jgi:8-oxo-dGTP diphosphatase